MCDPTGDRARIALLSIACGAFFVLAGIGGLFLVPPASIRGALPRTDGTGVEVARWLFRYWDYFAVAEAIVGLVVIACGCGLVRRQRMAARTLIGCVWAGLAVVLLGSVWWAIFVVEMAESGEIPWASVPAGLVFLALMLTVLAKIAVRATRGIRSVRDQGDSAEPQRQPSAHRGGAMPAPDGNKEAGTMRRALLLAGKAVMWLSILLWLAAIGGRLLTLQVIGSPERYARWESISVRLLVAALAVYVTEWFICLGYAGSSTMEESEKTYWNTLLIFFGPVAVPFFWLTHMMADRK